ncbi:MAG: tetratricopeptide repeat protein [Moraxellaceae bacterium]|nr:tetratricopeptide repeat protein [Moraxellaceae bacterium]MBH2030311.1 tetratricopeptide repeat protein [Moraxellaceae bacterium]
MVQDLIFKKILNLINEQQYEYALDLLYDPKLKRINNGYKHDENHAWYLVADLFYKLGDLEDAKSAFTEAIKIWHEDIDAYIGLSNILNEQKRYKEAIIVLEEILSFSNDSRLIYNLANNLFDQKLFLDAINQYKKIPEKDRLIYALAVKNMKKAEKQLKFKNK